MEFNIERIYHLPYEKDVCLNWLLKHLDYGLQNPSAEDLAWIAGIERGEEPKLSDLIEFRLSPSIWYHRLQCSLNFSLLTCIDWINMYYDEVLLEQWDGWVLDEIGLLLDLAKQESEQENLEFKTVPDSFVSWLNEIQKAHINGVAIQLGLPVNYHHGNFTRTLQFNLAHPSSDRIPNEYKPTKLLDPKEIKEMADFCEHTIAENITA